MGKDINFFVSTLVFAFVFVSVLAGVKSVSISKSGGAIRALTIEAAPSLKKTRQSFSTTATVPITATNGTTNKTGSTGSPTVTTGSTTIASTKSVSTSRPTTVVVTTAASTLKPPRWMWEIYFAGLAAGACSICLGFVAWIFYVNRNRRIYQPLNYSD